MTWSGRSKLRVSAGAYTVGVRIQTIHKDCFVRYTSYELLFDGRNYFEANEAFVLTAAAILKLMNYLID